MVREVASDLVHGGAVRRGGSVNAREQRRLLIQRSAWKGFSANFPFTAFYEVRWIGVKEGPPLPPPDMAADPKSSMIASIRGPVSVKNNAFAVCVRLPLGSTIGPGKRRTLLISPLLERPAFPFPYSPN